MFSKEFMIRWFKTFVILLVVLGVLSLIFGFIRTDSISYGFPLKYYSGSGFCIEEISGPCESYNYLNLFLDFIIWLVVAFGITYVKEITKAKK